MIKPLSEQLRFVLAYDYLFVVFWSYYEFYLTLKIRYCFINTVDIYYYLHVHSKK